MPVVLGCAGPVGERAMSVLAGTGRTVRHRPRRGRCGSCGATHVLLEQGWLCRRADAACVIGAALEAKAGGAGHRSIARRLGRPVSTVRGWLRRFASRSEQLRAGFTRLLHELDPAAGPLQPRACPVGDAVEAIGRAAAAAVLRLCPQPPWEFAARVTGGRLLAPAVGVG